MDGKGYGNIDGGEAADKYIQGATNIKLTGQKIANILESFLLSFNFPDYLEKHCIGVSLGPHVCGFIGKHMTLQRITGKSNTCVRISVFVLIEYKLLIIGLDLTYRLRPSQTLF